METLGMIDPGFWEGKRIFVTGHTGFKGSWLTQWLLILGATVKGYSLEPPTEPNLFTILGLAKEIDQTISDIRDDAKLATEIRSFKPDIVFHLAAQPLVRLSYKEPKLTYETNVMGTLNLYEAVRSCESVYAVVSITTDKCYENKEWIWGYRENDPMGGYDPYSSSKGCVEILSGAYRRSFFNPEEYGGKHHMALATARAGNVIGGGDWAEDRLIPDIMRSLINKKGIIIRNPNSIRPWQHVLEPLSGYLILAQQLLLDGKSFCEGWNFGPNDEDVKSVEWIVKKMCEKWGDDASYRIDNNPNYHEATYLKLDISKARQKLGWKPKWALDEALNNVIEWFKINDKIKATLLQISKYSKVI